jgi:hypothetical protein
MQKNSETEAKAQEEAERERKREAIRQRIAAAKASSAGAVSDGSSTKQEITESKDCQGKDNNKVKDSEKSSQTITTEIVQTGLTPKIEDVPDCYDVDPASFSTLPLPTKEAGEALTQK